MLTSTSLAITIRRLYTKMYVPCGQGHSLNLSNVNVPTPVLDASLTGTILMRSSFGYHQLCVVQSSSSLGLRNVMSMSRCIALWSRSRTVRIKAWRKFLRRVNKRLEGLRLPQNPRPDRSHSTHYLSEPPCHEGCPTSLPEGGLMSPKKPKNGGKPSPKRVRKPVSRKPRKGGRGTLSIRTAPRKTTQTSTVSRTQRKTR